MVEFRPIPDQYALTFGGVTLTRRIAVEAYGGTLRHLHSPSKGRL